MSPRTRRDLVWVAALWVILSALGELVVRAVVDHYPVLASSQARVTGEAVFFLLHLTVPLLVLITLILVYSAIRHRASPGDQDDSPAQYRYGRAFTWSWVGLSVVLNVLFIVHPGITGLRTLADEAAAASDPLEVRATARQWEWAFSYPSAGLENQRTLVVPVDRTIKFVLHSNDVIHSFWVPAWGMKMAVLPGQTRSLYITPDMVTSTQEEPTARVQCAQICGVGHAEMQAAVRVVSAEDFSKWLESHRTGGMRMEGMDMGNMEHGGQMEGEHQEGMPGMDMGNMQHDEDMNEEHGDSMPEGMDEHMDEGMDMESMQHGEAGDQHQAMEEEMEMNMDSDHDSGMEGMQMEGHEEPPQ